MKQKHWNYGSVLATDFTRERITKVNQLGEFGKRKGRLRSLLIENLEDRLPLATVSSSDFAPSGGLYEGVSTLSVRFDSPVQNSGDVSNYEIRRAGADRLLLADDPVEHPLLATPRGDSVVLQFSGLTEDVYQIVIKDNVLDTSGNKLDGNYDGIPGGDWRGDFVVNRHEHNLEPISVTEQPSQYGSSTSGWGGRSVSADGRYITFLSTDTNLVPGDVNHLVDVFWKDMVTGEVRLVSASATGVQTDFESYSPSISADGRYVVFESAATRLASGFPEDPEYRIYVKDMQTNSLQIVSSRSGDRDSSYSPSMSADGRFVVFESSMRLTTEDDPVVLDIFLKDLQTGAVTLISKDGNGLPGNGRSTRPFISSNGQFVVFESQATNFSANDTNGKPDIFLKNVATGSLNLISVSTSGQIANDASRFARVNDDGTLVTFLSLGSNLGANDNNSSYDIFVRDLTTGTTTLHSRTPSGEAAMYGANYGSLDSSGRYLAFSSNSSDLLMGDNNGNLLDVFIKDLQTGIIEKLETEYRNNSTFFAFPWINDDFTPTWSQDGAYLIYHSLPDSSISEEPGIRLFRRELATGKTDVVNTRHNLLPGSTGSGNAFNPSVSETGRYVAFESNSNILEVNGSNGRDVYLRDRELRRTMKVSTTFDGSNADGLSRSSSIDGSGRLVAFESGATNLIPGDTNGKSDIFMRNMTVGNTTRLSVSSTGEEANGDSSKVQFNTTGTHATFSSKATNLVADDSNGFEDIFVRNLVTRSTVRASTNSEGGQANNASYNASVSDDGRYVVFESSAANLVPGDSNSVSDVFVKDLHTGIVRLVSESKSGQIGNEPSYDASLSPDGRWVSFTSNASNLTPQKPSRGEQVLLKDLLTGEVVVVAGQANGRTVSSDVSRNGEYVSFATNAANLESYTSPIEYNFRVFVMNMTNGVITRQMPKINSGETYIPHTDISGDGSTVAFATLGSIYGEDYNGKRDVYASDVQSASSYMIGRQFFTLFTVDTKGIGTGSILAGSGNLFDSYNRLVLEGREYNVNSRSSLADSGQTVQLPSFSTSRAQVSREVFSPKTGDYAFVRTVDVISNKTNSSRNFSVSYFGNLGSNERTRVFATSDGDLIIEPTDTWFGTDDEADDYPYHTSSSAIIHLLHGPDGLKPNISLTEDNLRWSYSVPLAAQGTARIASFAIVAGRRENAITAVNVLFNQTGFNPQALAFLTSEESDFVNFRFRQPALLLDSSRSQFREDAGASAATVTILRIGDLSTPLTVQLPASDNSAATWPNSVTFPVNADSVQVPITATDDSLLDGSQSVTMVASAEGYSPVQISFTVLDAEGLRLTPSVESLPENAGAQAATLTIERLNSDIGSPITVNLTSSDTSELRVPASVTIPANASSATVYLDVIDDSLLDGIQSVMLAAFFNGYDTGTREVQILDYEKLSVSFNRSTVLENAGEQAALLKVTRPNSNRSQALTVQLTSSSPSEFAIPDSITIPANAAFVTIPIHPIDDQLIEEDVLVTVTATAAGYEPGAGSIVIQDMEPLTLQWSRTSFREDTSQSAAVLTVIRPDFDRFTDLIVKLQTSDQTELLIPSTVTIPNGETSVDVNVIAVDDRLLDGVQQVSINATAAGYEPSISAVSVLDAESLSLSWNKQRLAENGGREAAILTLSRSNTDLSQPLIVQLSNSNPSEISIPTSVTIPALASSVQIAVEAIDDTLMDGERLVQVRAHAESYDAFETSIFVDDVETITLTASRTQFREDSGMLVSRVSVVRSNTDSDAEVVVLLNNPDAGEIAMPASVTIPAGTNSTEFYIDAVDDQLLDGLKLVTVSSSASGYVDGSIVFSVEDAESLQISLNESTILENAGSGAAMLTIRRSNLDIGLPLVVNLASLDPTEVGLAATATIPANQSEVTVPIHAIDDDLLDGTQTISVQASAFGYASANEAIEVQDAEQILLSLSHASITESAGVGAVVLRIHRSNSDIDQPLSGTLSFSDLSELRGPTTFEIPAQHTSISIPLDVVDDTILDGMQMVTISASAGSYSDGLASLAVADEELISVTSNVSQAKENAGSNAAVITVSRSNSDRSTNLLVLLTSSDLSEAVVPASVVIPAGQSSTSFSLATVDDSLLDGPQIVSISATAVGYEGGVATLSITDVEALVLSLNKGTIRENDGPHAAELTIRRSNTDLGLPVQISLMSSLVGEISLPATLQIPTNSASITIPVDAIDDHLLDGLKTGTLTATAAGYLDGVIAIEVSDVEVLTLQLDQSGIFENGGQLVGTLRRSNTDTGTALTVVLASNEQQRLSYPATVIIPAGVQSTTFNVLAIDDRLRQGDVNVDLHASANGYSSASGNFALRDREVLSTNFVQSQIAENAGTTQLIVSRSDTASTDALLVQLIVDRPELMQVPTSVTIPAGQSSVSIGLVSIDDLLFDGDTTIKISASAVGMESSESSLLIIDEETKKPGTNPRNALDVNNDGIISPLDSLLVLNRLNLGGVIPLTEQGRYYDTSSDLIVSPLDVLRIINYLNLNGSGEGEHWNPTPQFMKETNLAPTMIQNDLWSDLEWLDGGLGNRKKSIFNGFKGS